MAFVRLSKEAQYVFTLLIAFNLFIIWDQLHWWQTIVEYNFGYIIPLFVAYILWDRWPEIKATLLGDTPTGATKKPGRIVPTIGNNYPGLTRILEIILICGLILSLFIFLGGSLIRAAQGARVGASLSMTTSFGYCVLASVFLISKRNARQEPIPLNQRLRLTALFIFPSLVWLLSIPMLDEVQRKLSLFLLNKVTTVVFFTFEAMGMALIREGNILLLPEGQVGVAEACSGIRSLTACLFTGAFLGAAFLNSAWKKLSLIALAMLFAFLTNILRSLFLTAWAYANGSAALEDKYFDTSVHDITGYAVLVLTSIAMLILLPLFKQKETPNRE